MRSIIIISTSLVLFLIIVMLFQHKSYSIFDTIENVNEQQFKKLISKDITLLNQLDKNQYSVLQKLILHGNINLVEFILNKQSISNLPFHNGDTPLITAITAGFYNITKLLLEKYQANPHYRSAIGKNIAQIAYENKQYEILHLLIKHGVSKQEIFTNYNSQKIKGDVDLFTPNELELTKLINQGNTAIVKKFIEAHPLINFHRTDNNQNSFLHYTASKANTDILKYILNKSNIPINQTNNQLVTPIMTAALNGYSENVKFLIQQHASILLKDFKENNILHYAVRGQNIDIINMLVQKNDLVNAHNFLGITPLDIAVSNNNLEIARILLENNANPNIRDKNKGMTPLHHAIEKNNIEMIKLLLEFNADKALPDRNNILPLEFANKIHANEDIIELLS